MSVVKRISFNASKVSKYGVFSNPYSAPMRENTDQKKTPYLDNFYAVVVKGTINC